MVKDYLPCVDCELTLGRMDDDVTSKSEPK